MTENTRYSGKHNLSTEDLLHDYLKDIFGSDVSCSPDHKHARHDCDEGVDEAFIELEESDSDTAYPQKSLKSEACFSKDSLADDELIVVSENQFDLLPQERKGAIEKFCVNRVAIYRSLDNNVLFTNNQFQVGDNGVKDGSFLIPMIDFANVSSKSGYRSAEEAHLLLLNSLYYLRRPLPERVRKAFLNYGEQALDDFHAAKWLAQFNKEALEEE